MAQSRQLFRRWRRDVGGPEPIGGDEPGRGEGDAGLLNELAHGRGPWGERRIAEPSLRMRRVAGIDRAAGERDVAGQEAALRAAPYDEHLGLAVPVGAHTDHRRGAADGSFVHGAILAGRRHTASVGTDPAAAIRAHIRAEGPITFATFMELALYEPGGFYDDPPVGAGGDFVTSPHVHPVFGTFLARALAELADALGSPNPLHITEVGAGDGTLARQILDELDFSYTAVEVSAGARTALREIEGIEVAEHLTAPVDVLVAHELLDNLPFRLVREGREVLVGLDGDTLVEHRVALDDEFAGLLAGLDTTAELVVPVGILGFVDELAEALARGYALLIDYGDESGAGEPHGYREHRIVEDLLAAPGATDITAGVDLGWVARRAEDRGLQAFPAVRQTDALLALGFEPWLRGELSRQQEQLAAGRGLEAVRTWSARSRASLLVDPGALGRMRWMLLATPELPEPEWLRRAQDRKTD